MSDNDKKVLEFLARMLGVAATGFAFFGSWWFFGEVATGASDFWDWFGAELAGAAFLVLLFMNWEAE